MLGPSGEEVEVVGNRGAVRGGGGVREEDWWTMDDPINEMRESALRVSEMRLGE